MDSHEDYVIDFGMGLMGVFSHVYNVRRGEYSAIAVQKTHGETAAIQGIAQYFRNEDEGHEIVAISGGIVSGIKQLKDAGYSEIASLVVVSRVHMAGQELFRGIVDMPDLLHEDGVLMARGPIAECTVPSAAGYDIIAKIVHEHGQLTTVVDHTFNRWAVGDRLEQCQLVVAKKTA